MRWGSPVMPVTESSSWPTARFSRTPNRPHSSPTLQRSGLAISWERFSGTNHEYETKEVKDEENLAGSSRRDGRGARVRNDGVRQLDRQQVHRWRFKGGLDDR